jgi:hypothetical protein
MAAATNETIEQQEADRKNAAWRIRLHRQLDALCDDAEARKGFHGSVLFEVFYLARRVKRFQTKISQNVEE